jgi:hypothetical protein
MEKRTNRKDKDSMSEWFNSAETKTQAEIEAHYTEDNFPSKDIRYHSSGGGGAGSKSPYPKIDPLSRAYYDK